MAIIRIAKRRSFTTISNAPLNGDLSLEAMGLFVFLMSKPDSWNITISGLTSQLKGDNINKVKRALRELEASGYLVRTRLSGGDKGIKCISVLYEEKQNLVSNNSHARESSLTRNLVDEKSAPYIKTDIEVNTNTKVKTEYTSTKVDDSVKSFLIQLIGELGFSEQVQVTPKRISHLKSRLKRYSKEQMSSAAKAITLNPWLQGQNPGGKKYGTIDYLLRSDEQVETLLLDAPGQTRSRFQELAELQNA